MKRFINVRFFAVKAIVVFVGFQFYGGHMFANPSVTVDPVLSANVGEGSEFARDVESHGGIGNDLSGSSKISLDEPRFAYVNFSGFDRMPESKKDALKGWMEFFDGEGNYFRKRIIAGAQGNSSMAFEKKNIKFDLCEDEWLGDMTCDVTFGSWVKQDSFHLKAYYTDYLRGLGAVSYKIYDDIIADRGDMAHPWQRAGVDDADSRARCHPDGFPVAVYLNGEFYGIFSWQLKKHRKNMGMNKNNPAHIHLDGNIVLFNGSINWSDFEVRNPKTLYCQDGTKYDGDAPKELMGENSAFYDPANPDHVSSARVKASVKALSGYCNELRQMQSRGASEAMMREEFEKRFDVESLIDYTVFSSIVNNIDGWYKNWQWVTYDGSKWAVEPYDLDVTFGNVFTGQFYLPPEYNTLDTDPYGRFVITPGPAAYLHTYYAKDLDNRYAGLRDSGAITAEGIKARISDWHDRVGADNYEREYQVWNDSYCIRDMVMHPDWEWTGEWKNFFSVPEWKADVTYRPGDKCRTNMMIFSAVNENSGNYPCERFGYTDSLHRILNWVDRRVDIEDYYWNYDTTKIPTTVSPNINEISSGHDVVAIYDMFGNRLSALANGVNVIRYTDGTSVKVLVRR